MGNNKSSSLQRSISHHPRSDRQTRGDVYEEPTGSLIETETNLARQAQVVANVRM
jgi:hypothetical protein